MARLILVDFDRILNAARAQLQERPPDPGDEWECNERIIARSLTGPGEAVPNWSQHLSGNAPSIVAFAMNARSVVDPIPCTFELFTRLASLIAESFHGGGMSRVEIALSFVMPQAADAALERLLHEAGGEAGAAFVRDVLLVSSDRYLRRSFAKRLGQPTAETTNIGYWRLDPVEERAFDPIQGSAANPSAPPASWSAIVESMENAAWAAGEPLDFHCNTVWYGEWRARGGPELHEPFDLPDMARVIDHRHVPCIVPGLLSQVGQLQTTARGIERMGRMAERGPELPRIGAARPSDGVELNRGAIADAYDTARESPLGSGAVILEKTSGESISRATLRTRLPVHVIVDICRRAGRSARPALRPGILDDRFLIDLMIDGEPYGTAAPVVFERAGPSLHIEVERPFGQTPPIFWNDGKGHVHGFTRVKGWGERLTCRELVVPARSTRIDGEQIVLMGVISPGESIHVAQDIEAHHIGLGHASERGNQPVAVLAPMRLLAGSWRCVPIQHDSCLDVIMSTLSIDVPAWRKLRQLPLVVPDVRGW